jgi:hypothetical protein
MPSRSSSFRRFALLFALAALLGCALPVRAQSADSPDSDKPKPDTDYSLVVKRLNGSSDDGTAGVKKVLVDADVYYRMHAFNSSATTAHTVINYIIYDETDIDRNGSIAHKVTNVPGTETFDLAPHSNKVLDTKAASARYLKYQGRNNETNSLILGVYVEMLVDGKKVDSYENPDGIRAKMTKEDKKLDQPALANGQN